MDNKDLEQLIEGFSLDLNGFQEYNRIRYPYIMIDYIKEVIPGKSARGYKNLSANEWFFPCHFPNEPNMPGMLQIEALVQMFSMAILTLPDNKGRTTRFVSVDNIKFKKEVLPGDRLDIESKVDSWKRGIAKGSGIGYINGKVACSADFVICIPEILEQYKPKRG